MGQIEDLRLFIQILQSGSISKAAVRLNLAKSAISRRLAQLEARYQTKLIDRSPGTWHVTETGEELYRRAMRAIEEVNEIDADFANLSTDLSGPLSLSVPRDFGLAYLSDALTAFRTRYSQISLTVDFDDRLVDLARENYDFAIRITSTTDEFNVASRIGTAEFALYASQSYLDAHPEPNSLDDLHDHSLLHYGRAKRASWDFGVGKKATRLNFRPSLNSNSGMFLLDATLSGLGISRLPDFITSGITDNGSLIQVLPDVESPSLGIFLLHPANRPMNRRMRIFAEEMKQACTSKASAAT